MMEHESLNCRYCPSVHPIFEQCYSLVDDLPLPYGDEAQLQCNAVHNGTLAEAKDDFTNGAIYNFTDHVRSVNGTIIGVKCKRRGCKKLVTFDGAVPQTYTAWAFKEPSGQPKQLCVITNFRSMPGAWNNVNCNCDNATYPCRFQAVCQTKDSCPKVAFSREGLTFDQTAGGETAESVERCSGFPNAAPKARRRCEKYGLTAFWEPFSDVQHIDCDQENIKHLGKISKGDVTLENVIDISQSLINLTDLVNSSRLAQDLEDTFESIVSLNETSEKTFQVTEDLVTVLDKLIEIADEERGDDYEPIEISPKFIQLLERQLTNLQRNGSNFTVEGDNFRIRGVHIPTLTFEQKVTFSVSKEMTTTISGEREINITFPEGLLNNLKRDGTSDEETVALTIIDYSNTVFFRNEGAPTSNTVLASTVIGINFEGLDVQNLSSDMPIIVDFPINRDYGLATIEHCSPNLSYTCSYWDITDSDGRGHWSSEGCETYDVSKDVVTCHCFHLTNLSVLVHESTNVALQLISKIGCALSMIGLSITIIFFILSRKTRTKESMRIQFRLCIAFLCFYAVFLGGIERKQFPCDQQLEEILCTASAALIHYFALCTMAWMCVEALHMYMLFVRATGARIPKFFLLARLFAWGFPAVLVAASLGKWYDDYTAESYCFLAWKGPLTYILLPFQGVMFAFNFVCYVIVALRLVCSKEMGSTKTAWQIASRRVRNAVAIAFLLGMSWAFGFMSLVYVDSSGQTSSTNAAPNVFDVLFCVTLSMNGIVVFILFCLRRDEFWEFLRKFCKRSTDVSQKFNDRDLITNERTTSIYNKSTMPVSSNSSV
ncbi:putative G-protein coupled receptor [Apostichopus japonicus]|uniref:Putative G-protein coupled receptor n=1 Tax=Stichopus japonicus TaxID=307972 RepID=A0A2G8LAL5_STIJA|nr:putative G-protein coupled receptor [Apostichopus japonicus]